MRLLLLRAPFLIALAVPLAWGQNLSVTQPALPLSLKRAVEIALAPDGSTRAALALESIDQAAQHVIEAKAAFLPSLDAAVQDHRQTTDLQAYGFSFKIPVPGFSLPAIVGPFSVLDSRATVQQSVLNVSDFRKFQAAKATLAAVKLDNDATRNAVADEVARDYLACLRADADRDTAQRQRRALRCASEAGPAAEGRRHRHRDRCHAGRGAARQRPPVFDPRRQ